MLTWLRLIADRIMRRNGKPSRLDAATRMAMDAYFTPPSRSSQPPPPDAARHARGQAPMRRYICPGFDPVEAANAVEAANSFAEQAAVSECGLDGYMRPMSIRFLRSDGVKTTFTACVRCHKGRGIAEGYDVYLTVEEATQPASTGRREPR